MATAIVQGVMTLAQQIPGNQPMAPSTAEPSQPPPPMPGGGL
jgi:hypothetical protein